MKLTALGRMLPLIFLVALLAPNVVGADQAKKPTDQTYQRRVIFSGEVQTTNAFQVTVPSTMMNPATIRFFLPEGSQVKKGDVILRVESMSESDLERVELELVQTRERGTRELADLEVKMIDAERALLMAKAALEKAKIDAALPKAQISALDFDKYRNERDRAERDLGVKQMAFDAAKGAIARKQEDNQLAVKRLQVQIAYSKLQAEQAEVRSDREGVLIHGYDSMSGKRLDEGGRAMIGSTAGQVMGTGNFHLVAWILEVDRPYLKLDQSLAVHFDAIPNSLVQGKVKRISGAPEPRAIWGSGKYFKVEIALPEMKQFELKMGMSAQIEVLDHPVKAVNANHPQSTKAAQALVSEIGFEGEVLSRQAIQILPPTIHRVWQYNLVMMSPDGGKVKQGDVVATFEANEVKTRMETNRSMMREKERALEKMRLDHAEAEKAATLAVSEAKSNAEKAARKASLPKELVKRIDYDKFVIDRETFALLAQLAQAQRDAQQRARQAEYRGLQSEIATLKQGIDVLEKGLRGLVVRASRDGTILHNTNYEGEKIAVGSKVFMGTKVATLADPDKLYVSAKVPEAQSSLLKLGQIVKVQVPGTSDTLSAKVSHLGVIYHGKSVNEPAVVRDVELEFVNPPKDAKPGTLVQIKVNLETKAGAKA